VPILFGVVLLDLIGFGIVIPILPFLSPQLGATKVDIALIIVTYAAGAGLCGGFWGRLSDRLGRKRVIMICLAGASLAYVLLGLATELWMIYAARGFAGLMAGNFGVASAMMADITRPENRARGMGLIGAAWGLGIMLGPFLGGVLSGSDGDFTWPCVVAGGMSALAILAAALFLPESVSLERRAANREQQRVGGRVSTWAMLRDSGNRLLALQYLLHNSTTGAFTYLVPLWTGDLLGWGAREVGMLFGAQGAIMVVLQGGLLAQLVRILGEWRLLRTVIVTFLAGVLLALAATVIPGASEVPLMVASVFIAMSGGTLCIPLLNTIASHRTPVALRGQMLGTTSAASSWGRVCGPLLAAANLALFGYGGAFLGCVLTLAAYLSWALWDGPERRSG
jgi:DHA1 family tetracycline resistance protein-like MFS transporter